MDVSRTPLSGACSCASRDEYPHDAMEDGRGNAPFVPPITAASFCTESGILTSRQVAPGNGWGEPCGVGGAGEMDISATGQLGVGRLGRAGTDISGHQCGNKDIRNQNDRIAWVMAKRGMICHHGHALCHNSTRQRRVGMAGDLAANSGSPARCVPCA